MKVHLFLTSCFLSASLVTLPPNLVQANSPVLEVLSSDAQGLNGKLSTVTVWPGAGANLNFVPISEIVKNVWLDDPSQIVLSFDGPMCVQAGDRGGDNCSNSAARIIHLKRIHAIDFPDLPQTSSTLLSVVTRTSTGEEKLYLFRIVYGKGTPEYHAVAIHPDPQVIPTDARNGLVQTQLQNVALGLRVAKSRNLLGRNQGNQRLELRVQNFLDLVSSGTSPQSASQQAGVSLRVISKLASLGITSVAQQQAQILAQNQTENLPPAPQQKRSPDRATQRSFQSATNLPATELNQPRVSVNQLIETNTSRPKQQPAFVSPSGSRSQQQKTEPPTERQSKRSPDRATQRSPNSVASPPVTKPQQPEVSINQTTKPNASTPKQPSASTIAPGARTQRQKTTTSVLSSARRTSENLNVVNTPPLAKKPLLTQTSSRLPPRVIPQHRLIATATADKSSATTQSYSQQALNDANAVAFGLAVAKHKGQINPNTLTWKKAQGAIRQLRLGKSREEAARRAGIDMATLSQLIKWGQNRP